MANLISYLIAGLVLSGLQVKPAEYLLGPDDQITITTVGLPQFSGDFLIPQSGIVNLPVIGNENLNGMTLEGLSRLINEAFKRRLKNPEVLVNLKTPRIDRVSVLGDLKSPGVYPIRRDWRILDVLSAAGGLQPGLLPGNYTVRIVRGSERQTVQLQDVLSGDPAANLRVHPEDVVSLTTDALVPVNVIGMVRNPGLYRLPPTMSGILEALAQAGGSLDNATLHAVKIRHLSGVEDTVDLTQALQKGITTGLPILAPGDLIIIPESMDRFAVLGAVDAPGIFPMVEGRPIMLADAVALAKGSDAKDARFRYIGIIRSENGKTVRKVYDLGKFLKLADASQNPAILPGDVIYVPQNNHIKFADLLRDLTPIAIFAELFRHP